MTRYKASITFPACERPHRAVASNPMNKNLRVGLGVLLVMMGLIWTTQGLGYLKGSPMTGVTFWAIVGPVVALGGLALIFGRPQAKP